MAPSASGLASGAAPDSHPLIQHTVAASRHTRTVQDVTPFSLLFIDPISPEDSRVISDVRP